jgi:hypothetical protein
MPGLQLTANQRLAINMGDPLFLFWEKKSNNYSGLHYRFILFLSLASFDEMMEARLQ